MMKKAAMLGRQRPLTSRFASSARLLSTLTPQTGTSARAAIPSARLLSTLTPQTGTSARAAIPNVKASIDPIADSEPAAVSAPGMKTGKKYADIKAATEQSFDVDAFTQTFLGVIREELPSATDPAKSASLLRKLIRSETIKFTDMRDAPEKFFLAHRLLSSAGTQGFGIRFTVQFNLFAGSVLGLGGPEQIAQLDTIQREGKLGCFLLTEKQAGVLSGLIVETTADWSDEAQEFVLHTPNEKAAKNWISQGFVADLGVVIADLRIGGVSYGPHPFIMPLRDEQGALLDGIVIEDMGTKTIANDLDNARVSFDQVRLPKHALLDKFATIDEAGNYVQKGDERMRIEVIGQRLMTGRLAIAEAALVAARVLTMRTEAYAQDKVCNGLAGERSLASMPQLAAVFEESYAELDELAAFTAGVEKRLNDCLRTGTIPDANLVDAIAVTKIKCIESAVERTHALRKEVGSYALMHTTGFELVDMFLCMKFAEGDSRILQQKLVRDRLKALQKGGLVSALGQIFSDSGETLSAISLARKLAPAGRDLEKMSGLMDKHWREIYDLAEHITARHMRTGEKGTFCEPMVDRGIASDPTFDHEWKEKL